MTLIDLSHEIADGMTTYPGLPAPTICDYWTRGPGRDFHIARIEMVANTGTYIDAPYHRYESGADLAQLALDRCADLDAVVVRADFHHGLSIDADRFAGLTIAGRAVLVHTGWDRHWGSNAYFNGHPHLTAAAAEHLRDRGVRLVGIDSLNIDATDGATRPVHETLLGAGIPIVEHLCGLDRLPDHGFRFSAAAPKFRRVGSFPVRAMAVLPLTGA